MQKYKGISLFSGAGGMDVGFKKAGFEVLWANEIDKDAYNTFKANHPDTIINHGDINLCLDDLKSYEGVDVVFGGPPCQGFSVAGKMNPDDDRNTLIWSFLEAVRIVRPKVFVLENVKALATLNKWKDVRERIFNTALEMGYSCDLHLLNSADFGVPQNRERVFFIGFLNEGSQSIRLSSRISRYHKTPKTVRETIIHLGPAGTDENPLTCTAKITFAKNPIMRKSPYAGMMFNGAGRPLNLESTANTLPASMGGNKTPIIDEEFLHGNASNNWIVDYHSYLTEGKKGAKDIAVPKRLRRLTINEAALIQSFPKDYIFCGSKSSIYKQIGNAVPCLLAEAVATAVIDKLENSPIKVNDDYQLSFDSILVPEAIG